MKRVLQSVKSGISDGLIMAALPPSPYLRVTGS